MRGFIFEETFELGLKGCFKRSKDERKQRHFRQEWKKYVVEWGTVQRGK